MTADTAGGPDGRDRLGRRAIPTVAVLALFAGALAIDEPAVSNVARHQTRTFDAIADAVDPFGRARVILPGLAIAYGQAVLTHHSARARGVLRIAAGYVFADMIGGALKVSVGRHRPDSTYDAWRFASLRRDESWHSFPSGHTYHAFAIASGIAESKAPRWTKVTAYGVATVVGAQRVYTGAHWPSDVIAGVFVGIFGGKTGRRIFDHAAGPTSPVYIAGAPGKVIAVVPIEF